MSRPTTLGASPARWKRFTSSRSQFRQGLTRNAPIRTLMRMAAASTTKSKPSSTPAGHGTWPGWGRLQNHQGGSCRTICASRHVCAYQASISHLHRHRWVLSSLPSRSSLGSFISSCMANGDCRAGSSRTTSVRDRREGWGWWPWRS